MTQTRKGSLIEAAANILVGFVIALISQLIIFPAYGVHVPLSTDLAITGWFTLVSLVRSYCIRRWLNKLIQKATA